MHRSQSEATPLRRKNMPVSLINIKGASFRLSPCLGDGRSSLMAAGHWLRNSASGMEWIGSYYCLEEKIGKPGDEASVRRTFVVGG